METYVIRTPEDVRVLKGRLANPRPFLEGVGTLLRKESQLAFASERLGEIVWPHRYPGQRGQYLHVAEALTAANKGTPKSSMPMRFRENRDKPLNGIGDLQRSVKAKVDGNSVTVGSPLSYASTQFYGGDSYQDITQTARDTIRTWLKGDKQSVRGVRGKLHSLLTLPFLVTKVNARPFIGVTPRAQALISRSMETFLTEGKRLDGNA